MSFIAVILLCYGIGITIAFIVSNSTKDKYIRKYLDLEKRYKQLQGYINSLNAGRNSEATQNAPQNVPAAPSAGMTSGTSASNVPAPAPSPAATSPSIAPVNARTTSTLPAYSPIVRKEKKNGIGAVGASFAVGVLLMVIAAAVFISATWQSMPAGFKCLILAAVVAVVYGFSVLCRRKLKLDKTASVLYMLGSLITPLAVFIGFLAFEFEETSIILSCCALSLGITGFAGYKIYGSKLQVAISYIGFVWMDIFICMELLGNYTGFVTGLCSAAFISGVVYYIAPKLKFFDLFAECSAYAAALSFLMSVGIENKMMAAAIASQIMYWITLLLLNRKRSFIKYFSAVVPVCLISNLVVNDFVSDLTLFGVICAAGIAVMFAVYKLTKQENCGSNAIISVIMSALLYTASDGLDPKCGALYYIALIVPVLSMLTVIIMSKAKWERNVYTYLLFATVMILIESLLNGALPFFILAGVAVIAFVAGMKLGLIHIPAAASASAIISFFIHISYLYKHEAAMIIFASSTVLLYALLVFAGKKTVKDKASGISLRCCSFALITVSNIVLMILASLDLNEFFVALMVIDVVLFAITLFDDNNYFGILPSMTFMNAVVIQLVLNDIDLMLAGAVMIVVFVLIGRLAVCERIFSKNRVDWLTFLAGIACLLPIGKLYMTTFLISLFIMTFTGRFSDADSLEEKVKSNFRIILSAAVGMLFISFSIVNITYTDSADFEVRLLFILTGAFIIRFFINPGKASRWIWFSSVALCIELEAMRAMVKGDLLPLTLVSLFVCVIFIYSFIAKKRSWFILSISNIGLIGIMFAITFWESKLWWIYLLVLGGILIGTASVNEYKRRRAIESGLEDKKVRLFDSWEW